MTRVEVLVAIDDLDYASETPDQPLKAVKVGTEVGKVLNLESGETIRLTCGDSDFDITVDGNLSPQAIELQ